MDVSVKSTPYKQYIHDISLSIERCTEGVPPDGKYYVLLNGEIKGKHSSLKKAQTQFKEIVSALGYKPEAPEGPIKSAYELDIERYMDSKELYWAESYRFREGGGKGGRGGI